MRVVVFNDSPTVRASLRAVLETAGEFEVVAEAEDGRGAVDVCRRAAAEVVLMDVVMPHVDGLVATRAIAAELSMPVVIVSAVIDITDPDELFAAMQAGAVFVMEPPYGGPDSRGAREFIQTLRNIVQRDADAGPSDSWRARAEAAEETPRAWEILGIAASAGGPGATSELIQSAGRSLPPTLLVQHLAAGFSESYARWLSKVTGVPVVIAGGGEAPQPNTVFMAPHGRHILMKDGHIALTESPRNALFRPSADVLFGSLTRYGPGALAIVLSGLGDDGARGAESMRAGGAGVWVQDAGSSAVFGMPGAVWSRCGADFVGTPGALGRRLHGTNEP